jgi:hypothetical protein
MLENLIQIINANKFDFFFNYLFFKIKVFFLDYIHFFLSFQIKLIKLKNLLILLF